MRIFGLLLVAALAACASNAASPTPTNPQLAAARGTALPPPAASAGPGQTAPPEGAGAGGLDFGRWRGADPAVYAPAFQNQVRERFANQEVSYIRADLERNGFACTQGGRLDCRIEIMERECAHDWYVVVERGDRPVAGFDVMCLGAR